MGRQAGAEPAQTCAVGELRELSDPEFFARWAAVRRRMALAVAGTPGHAEMRKLYGAVAAEYRRRLDGA